MLQSTALYFQWKFTVLNMQLHMYMKWPILKIGDCPNYFSINHIKNYISLHHTFLTSVSLQTWYTKQLEIE